MKINCIIVDDDEIMRKILSRHVEKTPFLNLTGAFESAIEASNFLLSNETDLILLDVMMPAMTGMELIKTFGQGKSQIVLITSEKEFASEAFDFDVTDYIVKPVTYERFLKAIIKVKRVFEAEESTKSKSDSNHLFIKVNGRYLKIDMHDIHIIEALADYVSIYTSAHRYIVHSTMKSIQAKLPEKDFIRIHNSYIVRLDKITEIEDNTLTINKKVLPISRAHQKELKEHLKLL